MKATGKDSKAPKKPRTSSSPLTKSLKNLLGDKKVGVEDYKKFLEGKYDFDHLIAKARAEAKKIGLKKSNIQKIIMKPPRRKAKLRMKPG